MRRDTDPETSHAAGPQRLSDAAARRVLARATEREADWETPRGTDAAETGVPVARLREAAIEAGISAAAFDAALAELRSTEPPHRGRRHASRALSAAALAAALLGGVTVVWRGAERATSAPVAPLTRGPADDLACAAPGGVPVERLRALARRLHPEAFAVAGRHGGAVVGLLFDAQCALTANALTSRAGDELTVDTTLARLFPSAYHGAIRVAGIAEAEAAGPAEPGEPWIVWGVTPPTR